VFTGTAEPGSTLTMTLDVGSNGTSDVTYTTRTASDGSWRVDTATAVAITGSLPTIAEGVTTSIAARATDAAGNASPLATGTVTLDTIAPGQPTIDSPLLTNNPTPPIEGSADPGAIVTVSLDLDRNGTTDVSFTTTAGSSGTYSIDLGTATPSSGSLPGGKLGDLSTTDVSVVASDLAGNASPAATAVLRVDTSIPPPPTIDAIAGDGAINATEAALPVTVTGTLDAAYADRPVSVQWGTVTRDATVSGTAWTITFAPGEIPDDGVEAVRVTYRNVVGTTSAEATQGVLIDRVPPTPPTITDNVAGTATGPITFSFAFAEPVRGFTAADVAVTGGSKGAFTGAEGDSVYTLVVTPNAGVNSGTVSVSVPAGAFNDLAGNSNVAAAPAYAQPYDTLAPTIAITDNASGTASGPVTFTFTFSEPVTGFTADDVTVGNGTKGAFNAVSATVYTLVVTPETGTTGNLTLSVAAGAATDTAGNASVAQSAIQPIDTVTPTLAITDNVAGTANGPVTFTFTFSEPVTGFTAEEVSVTGGTKGALSGSGASYQMVVTPATDATGTIAVSVAAGAGADAAGNPSGADTASRSFDTNVPPTLAITDNVAGTANGAVTFTFTFSEPVTGFTTGDITVAGGDKGALTGSGASYQMVVTPTADTAGTITVDVPAGTVTDLAGNPSIAPASASQAYDVRVPPTLTSIVDSVPGDAPTNDPVTFTFTFSEAVNNFTANDVTVTNGSKGTFTGSNGDSVYTLEVTPPGNATGTIGVSVAGGVATDLAGNPNVASGTVSQPFDTQAPTIVSIALDPPSSNGETTDTTPTLVLNFSEIFGTSLEVLRDNVPITGTIETIDADTVRFTDGGALLPGTYEYAARMTDAAGNVGAFSSAYTVIVLPQL